MAAVAPLVVRGPSRLLIATVLGALALGALWFILHNAWQYTHYNLQSYTDYYWPRRGALIPHITGGVIAISAGLIQLWLGLTNRVGVLHRTLGKVYVLGALLGCVGGYYMVLTIPAKYPVYAAGLFMLSTAWLITTSMAIVAIRYRNVAQHRDWMVRSYTVTFAFVTFRLIDQWLTRSHIAAGDDVDAIMAWACWSVPLLLAEPLIQLRKLRPGRASIRQRTLTT
ncbi:MAG TPA: DUF2306 domain-containing protein [Steroidobacteraceae bacterium]